MANLKTKLTPERRAEILSAMDAANGVKAAAVKILGCTTQTLNRHIKQDEVLRSRYDPTYKPAVVDTEIHRPASKDDATSIAIAKEEASLVGGWQDVGFTEEESQYLSGLSQFTNGKLDQVIDFTYGGMVKNATSLSLLVRDTIQMLKKVMENPAAFHEYNDDGAITYSGFRKMKELQNSVTEQMKEMRATNSAAEQTMITRAKIDEIKRIKEESNQQGAKRPGFGPVEVFGKPPNMTQHIHNHAPKDVTDV